MCSSAQFIRSIASFQILSTFEEGDFSQVTTYFQVADDCEFVFKFNIYGHILLPDRLATMLPWHI
jgi:hypothetical protein